MQQPLAVILSQTAKSVPMIQNSQRILAKRLSALPKIKEIQK